MVYAKDYELSIVVPLYNEGGGLAAFHDSLIAALKAWGAGSFEIIYCDDGSTDDTAELVRQLNSNNPDVRLISLSRNFGKENALTAAIAQASGQAVIMLDGDGQHPVELIPEFIEAWQKGARVVVGVRTNSSGGGWYRRLGSRLFYVVFNKLARQKLIPGSTDFRLIDRSVQEAFLSLEETNRITRGLIDWLGFKTTYINFESKTRQDGSPGYSRGMLASLAMNSIVSLSPLPLYFFGYLGILITFGSLLLGAAVTVEQLLLGDPWHWRFTGTAMLSILLLFLVGILLMAQGLLSLYISHIHNQSKQRPLYVIDYAGSAGINKQINA